MKTELDLFPEAWEAQNINRLGFIPADYTLYHELENRQGYPLEFFRREEGPRNGSWPLFNSFLLWRVGFRCLLPKWRLSDMAVSINIGNRDYVYDAPISSFCSEVEEGGALVFHTFKNKLIIPEKMVFGFHVIKQPSKRFKIRITLDGTMALRIQ